MNGNIANQNAPGINELKKYGVNVSGVMQVVNQPLYHYQTYAAAGASTFTFFQNPRGQNGLTYEDTNMESAGQLPSPKMMLVTGIEICFWSGAPATSLQDVAPAGTQLDDLNAIRDRGHVQLFVGSKAQYDDAGLEHFPTGNGIQSENALADATTAAPNLISVVSEACFAGRVKKITPLVLQSNQNFSLTVEFPNGVVAMPSGVDARIGARLLGFQYRLAQ